MSRLGPLRGRTRSGAEYDENHYHALVRVAVIAETRVTIVRAKANRSATKVGFAPVSRFTDAAY
jgi:hypothetical protein